ncbi:MAG: hypothetical protein ACK56F_12265, partial [bacterium]
FTLGELSTVVAEAAQVVNSRPIARNTGDPETGDPSPRCICNWVGPRWRYPGCGSRRHRARRSGCSRCSAVGC